MTSPVSLPAGAEIEDTDLDAYENLTAAWTTYVPDWTSSGTAPAIGNGTRSGAYIQVGKLVMVRGRLVFGSTSTFGTGSYRVSVPVTASGGSVNESTGSLWLFDNGTQSGIGTCTWVSTTTLWLSTASGDITNTSPWTWTTSDQIRWSIIYDAA